MSDIRIDTVYDNYGLKKRKPLTRKSFRGLDVYEDLVGKLEDFKAKNGIEVKDAVKDSIIYLKSRNLKKEYTLLFNDIKLLVSVNSDINAIERQYHQVVESRKEIEVFNMN